MLYCGTGHRLISEFLLDELMRKPTGQTSECRESMALSAGWALGMVLLKKGYSVRKNIYKNDVGTSTTGTVANNTIPTNNNIPNNSIPTNSNSSNIKVPIATTVSSGSHPSDIETTSSIGIGGVENTKSTLRIDDKMTSSSSISSTPVNDTMSIGTNTSINTSNNNTNNGHHSMKIGNKTPQNNHIAATATRKIVIDTDIQSESTQFLPSTTNNKNQMADEGLSGLSDLCIEDRLHMLIQGAKRRDIHSTSLFSMHIGSNQYDINSRSSRVLEGELLNTDITAIGAIVALSLIYLQSNNIEIAQRIALPASPMILDKLRPDFAFYRLFGICLILWDSVESSAEWVEKNIPAIVKKTLFIEKKINTTNTTTIRSNSNNTTTSVNTNYSNIDSNTNIENDNNKDGTHTNDDSNDNEDSPNKLLIEKLLSLSNYHNANINSSFTFKTALSLYLHSIAGV